MSDIKQRVALSSIAASAGLTTAKGVVGVMSGSLALLSEAAHSFIDLGATPRSPRLHCCSFLPAS